jgi:succinate-semialdehyde dehydrogenase / glutarate-semialdehyde dehydrogenase
MYKKYGLFINGAWCDASDKQSAPVFSPVTQESLGHVPYATHADTQEAIASAEKGFEIWKRKSSFERADALHLVADIMTRRRQEGAAMITLETGKPLVQADREWGLSIDQFRWMAEEARRVYGRVVESRVPGGRFEISHEPVGVAAAFTAWNFPAALAAGCAIIIRPSSQTPGVAMVMVDCIKEANLPAGVVNLVVGPTSTTYAPIMASAVVRKVSLTGSTRVGQQMLRDAADTVKKTSMELGGNAPLIVYSDADLELALSVSVPTKYANAGQVCVTADRFFIHESLHDAFVKGFVERARALKLGDGMDAATQMGPLINGARMDEMESIVEGAIAAGAKVATGGRRSPAHGKGFFYEPTVLVNVTDAMKVFEQENFGPIAAITTFKDDDEVIQRANASEMGLSGYAFTSSAKRIRATVAGLKVGMVGINSFAMAASEAPFGGTKYSGMGREGGIEGISDYLDTKLAQIVL